MCLIYVYFFFFKRKTAYEMRISDWSSDVCSSDLSHVTVPQIGAMYKGDRSRKETLVEFGFRLPSALDNRPLRFEEWEGRSPRAIFVSATPGKYEKEKSGEQVVELVVRPTGLVDPEVEIRPVATQVDDVLGEINLRVAMRSEEHTSELQSLMRSSYAVFCLQK